MRLPLCGEHSRTMTRGSLHDRPAGPDRALPRVRRPGSGRRATGWVLLAVTVGLAALLVGVAHGLAREYADPVASASRLALDSWRSWGLGLALVGAAATGTVAASRGVRSSRTVGGLALAALVVAIVGVPVGTVVGAQQRRAALPVVPSCTAGFTSGPAVPVVRAAQRTFDSLRHPGAFTGGGSSGVDGCSSELVVAPDVDVVAAYRASLSEAGWRLGPSRRDRLAATRDGQAVVVEREAGVWTVWAGPQTSAP